MSVFDACRYLVLPFEPKPAEPEQPITQGSRCQVVGQQLLAWGQLRLPTTKTDAVPPSRPLRWRHDPARESAAPLLRNPPPTPSGQRAHKRAGSKHKGTSGMLKLTRSAESTRDKGPG